MKKAIIYCFLLITTSMFSQDFVTTWTTTGNANTIYIPIARGISSATYNYVVHWGDGSKTSTISDPITLPSHTYTDGKSQHDVSITGVFPGLNQNGNYVGATTPPYNNGDLNSTNINKDNLIEIKQWGTNVWTSMAGAFMDCKNVKMTATDLLKFSDVTDMSYMFYNAAKFNGEIGYWKDKLSNVTNMSFMFFGATSFNGNISDWDVSNVKDMSFMFFGAGKFNQELSSWKISKVTNMASMFNKATAFDQSLETWDISSIGSFITEQTGSMLNMFKSSGLSTPNYDSTLIGWATLDTGEERIPKNITFNGGNSKYCKAEEKRDMLMSNSYGWTIKDGKEDYICNPFITTWTVTGTSQNELTITIPTDGVSNYNYNIDWGDGKVVENITSNTPLTHTYDLAKTYTVEISGVFPHINFSKTGTNNALKIKTIEQWGANKWASMESAFKGCSNLTINATDIPNLSNVKDMSSMFSGAINFNSDISSWDVSNIIDMKNMFNNAKHFNIDISNWNVSNVTDMSNLFSGADNFNKNLKWGNKVSSVTNMKDMFNGADNFNGDISDWNVGKVKNMSSMFSGADNFNGNISDWNVGYVTKMSGMFNGARKFNKDLSKWKVNNVTNMSGMFQEATAFNQNLGDWNISNVENMSNMFNGVKLSTPNYDSTLIGWATLDTGEERIPKNITFNGGNSKYCKAEEKRDMLMSNSYGWTIKDGKEDYICNPFITTWTVTGTSQNELTITIPTDGVSNYNYNIDWGDGKVVENITSNTPLTHTYDLAKTYTVEISGVFPHINFSKTGTNNALKIKTIEQWGANKWASMESAFKGCSNLTINATDIPNLSNVKDMSSMFSGAINFNSDISSWDVSNIIDMKNMFNNAKHFNIDISNWNVSNVTDMSNLFSGADNFNKNLKWGNKVSSVTNMKDMFNGADNFNGDISDWNVGKVKNMSSMFSGADNFNGNISDWNVGYVTKMSGMFNGARKFNKDLSKWKVNNVTNMSGMFQEATAFNQNLGDWNISNVENMSNMFNGVKLSTPNYDSTLIGWATLDTGEERIPKNITFNGGFSKYCEGSKAKARLLNSYHWAIMDGGISSNCNVFTTTWKTTGADEEITIPTDGTSTYNYVVDWGDGNPDTGGIGDTTHKYASSGTYTVKIAGVFPHIYFNDTAVSKGKIRTIEKWGINLWTSMSHAFEGCSNLISNTIDTPNLSSVTGMSYMFSGDTSFNSDISSWDVSNVINMRGVFQGASNFNGDITTWNISSVRDMSYMFSGATSFNQKLNIWNVSNVKYMNSMFFGAINFNSDVSSWDVSQVINMSGMFQGASNFNGDITAWNIGSVRDMSYMFSGATSFNQNLDIWNVSNVSKMISMFSGATSFDQSLGNWDIRNITDMTDMFKGITLSTNNYDNILIGWNTKTTREGDIPKGIAFSGGFSKYCVGEAARTSLNSIYRWTTTDSGKDKKCTNNEFVFTWEITTIGETITIPTDGILTYNYTVDWGDRSNLKQQVGDATHTYATRGLYVVKVTGVFPHIYFNDIAISKDKIRTIEQWGKISWKSMEGSFYGCTKLTGNAIDAPDLTNVEDLSNMFNKAISFNQEIDKWNVSSVINMQAMFSGAVKFNQELSNWKVGNVEDMSHMFSGAIKFNKDLDNWKVGNVEDMSYMFSRASSFNGKISTWNVSSVLNMQAMFSQATSFNQEIGSWRVDSVKDMSGMFYAANKFNKDLDNWRVGNVEDMSYMFSRTSSFNGKISTWNVSSVLNMQAMFSQATSFNQEIGSWRVGNVKDMSYMFSYSIFNGNLGDWNVSSVIKMDGMFAGDIYFNQNISKWDVSNVNDMSSMFYEATSFNQEIGSWKVGNVEDMSYMFAYSNFNENISKWDVSNVKNMRGMFQKAITFNQDLGNWKVGNVNDMSYMFAYSNFNQNISKWDVSNVKNMSSMFQKAITFNQDLGIWDISNIEDMSNMFDGVRLSTVNYDNILIGWRTKSSREEKVPSNIIFSAGNSIYCIGKFARDILTDTHYWKISDGGINSQCANSENLIFFKAYPNPTTGIIYISGDMEKIQRIQVYSIESKQIMTINKNFESINLSSLKQNIYFVTIKTKIGTQTFKIVKK